MLDAWFLRSEWLLLLVLLPLVYILLRKLQLRRGSWESLVAPQLKSFVLSEKSGSKMSQVMLLATLGAFGLAVLAAAGPKGENRSTTVAHAGDSLVVALDLSQSMNVADVRPSRLERARLKLKDILADRQSGETALVVFSASAFTVVPLTSDTETIDVLLDSLSSAIMPSRGSYPALAIEKSGRLLEQAGVSNGQVLLIGDDAGEAEAEAAARQLTADGHTLLVLGVGTPEGGPIPSTDGGFLKDNGGKVAVVRLTERPMQRLAAAGAGRYQRLRIDNADIAALFPDQADTGTLTSSIDEIEATLTEDLGIWLLLAALPLIALQFRRGWLFCVLLTCTVGLQPQTSYAFSIGDIFRNTDQRAERMMRAGEFAAAAAEFDNAEWQAAAHYRAGEFEKSAAVLASVDTATAHYNRGNALARAGATEAAIDAYSRSLELDSEHEDARYNKQLLESADDEESSGDDAQDSPQKSQGDSEEGGESSENKSDDPQEGGESSAQSSADEADEQQRGSGDDAAAGDEAAEREDGAAEEMSDEELQALQEQLAEAMNESQDDAEHQAGEPVPAEIDSEERAQSERERAEEQLLRLIRHDPGGLLRRKFRRQYRQQGRDQDGKSLWPDNEAEPW